MKITVVYGQNHKGSTYRIARMLAEKLDGDISGNFFAAGFWRILCGLRQVHFARCKRLVRCGKPAAHHTKIGKAVLLFWQVRCMSTM